MYVSGEKKAILPLVLDNIIIVQKFFHGLLIMIALLQFHKLQLYNCFYDMYHFKQDVNSTK